VGFALGFKVFEKGLQPVTRERRILLQHVSQRAPVLTILTETFDKQGLRGGTVEQVRLAARVVTLRAEHVLGSPAMSA
jgi:hypothetical protein